MIYYQVVKTLAGHLGKGASSVIDVGSNGCPYLDWLPDIGKKTSVDLQQPYEAPDVKSVTSDFLEWEPDARYDLVMCLQVLEHVPDAGTFAQKLLALGEVVIVSVPYKWEEGRSGTHVHDPVDEAKMLAWFGREPNYSYVCREVVANIERLIHVYDGSGRTWKGLKERGRIPKARPKPPQKSPASRAFKKFKQAIGLAR